MFIQLWKLTVKLRLLLCVSLLFIIRSSSPVPPRVVCSSSASLCLSRQISAHLEEARCRKDLNFTHRLSVTFRLSVLLTEPQARARAVIVFVPTVCKEHSALRHQFVITELTTYKYKYRFPFIVYTTREWILLLLRGPYYPPTDEH